MLASRQSLLWSSLVLVSLCGGEVSPPATAQTEKPAARKSDTEPIDFRRAKGYFDRKERGEKLTADEAAYLQRALEERRKREPGGANPGSLTAREKTGLKPLSDMTADDRHHGEDGGLYGQGKNTPPDAHRRAAEAELARIQTLDENGQPTANGRIVFVSISMSNATQEFSRFKRVADADPAKSPKVTIVDCAQGGQAMAEWAPPDARPWTIAEQQIANARVSTQQVQVAWIKLANKGPRGNLAEHGRKLQSDTLAVIQNAKNRFPNLKVIYLASRIYGGYATNALNPEPYAYESAFAARWLIQDQIRGEVSLNFKPDRGPVKAPLLLWGPYFWADGMQPRPSDKLIWTRADFSGDGTHPSEAGRDKVADLMLKFFTTDPLAKSWFAK